MRARTLHRSEPAADVIRQHRQGVRHWDQQMTEFLTLEKLDGVGRVLRGSVVLAERVRYRGEIAARRDSPNVRRLFLEIYDDISINPGDVGHEVRLELEDGRVAHGLIRSYAILSGTAEFSWNRLDSSDK